MIRVSRCPSKMSDEIADLAEQLAADLRRTRGGRYPVACQDAVRLSCTISELLVAATLLRRSPVAQQRLAQHLIDKGRDQLRSCRRDYDA